MEAEIAPSYKFKLAVNRGLPYLIPHGLSGELLPRRCTITVLSLGLLWVFRFCFAESLNNLNILRRLSMVLARRAKLNACHFGASHSILLFCGTVLTLTGTWVSQANLLFGLPGLSSHPIFIYKEQSSKFIWHRRYGYVLDAYLS